MPTANLPAAAAARAVARHGFEELAMPDDGGHGIVVLEVRRID